MNHLLLTGPSADFAGGSPPRNPKLRQLLELAHASPLVAQVMPDDPLDALIFDYRTLCGMAQAKELNEVQKQSYEICLSVLESSTIWMFRRNFALLFLRDAKLYRCEYASFQECAWEKARLKKSQANKACTNTKMTMFFDAHGKRHLMPEGGMEQALGRLRPDHWLPAG